MAIKNMSISTGATIAVTGGTAKAFVDTGVSVPGGVQVVVPASNANVRESATFRHRPAQLLPDGTYTRKKDTATITVPMVLASGKVVNNVIRIERDVHPEASNAAATDLNKLGAQLLVDADTDNFWLVGSLS